MEGLIDRFHGGLIPTGIWRLCQYGLDTVGQVNAAAWLGLPPPQMLLAITEQAGFGNNALQTRLFDIENAIGSALGKECGEEGDLVHIRAI